MYVPDGSFSSSLTFGPLEGGYGQYGPDEVQEQLIQAAVLSIAILKDSQPS
jgi:hypothetical protein